MIKSWWGNFWWETSKLQGLLHQGLFQQSLHSLATGQSVLPQVAAAAAAQQLQQFSESQQQVLQSAVNTQNTRQSPHNTTNQSSQHTVHHHSSQQQNAHQHQQQSHQSSGDKQQQQQHHSQTNQQNHHSVGGQQTHSLHSTQNKISANNAIANAISNNSVSNNTTAITNTSTTSMLNTHPPLKAVATRPTEPNPEEMTDLEELEQFAKTFKQRRIKLGMSSYLPISIVWVIDYMIIGLSITRSLSDPNHRLHSGRRWSSDGQTVRQWLQSDDDIPIRSP